LISCYW